MQRLRILLVIISASDEIISVMKKPQQQSPTALDIHAKLFRGLADSGRLGILLRLRTGPASAGELAGACGLTASNASNHLRCLLGCGLVTLEAQGRHNIYRLVDAGIAVVLDASGTLLSSPAGAQMKACCNYESVSRRSLRSTADAGARRKAPRHASRNRIRKVGTRYSGTR